MIIYVLGNKGMLGRYVYTYLSTKYKDIIGLSKPLIDAKNISVDTATFIKDSVVINCIGVIKRNDISKADFAKINAVFPHVLSDICKKSGSRLIHVTTDCVYDGLEGGYDEKHAHTAKDVYGMSKSLGEPEDATVIRTSIIGEEVGQARSLVEWVKAQANKEVNGFTNHFWNGITCLHFAKICEEIIEKNLFWTGVKHITSPSFVSKMELVQMISDIYGLGIKVNPFETPTKCDRTLSSIRNDINIEVPELREQIKEMQKFSLLSVK